MAELSENKERLEAKLNTDSALDDADKGVQKELDQVTLKIRWASDEKVNIYNDLEIALKILEDKNAFIEAQKGDIEELKRQLEEALAMRTEKEQEIDSLKGEIRQLNEEIETLTKEIEELDLVIEKLEAQIDEKQRELNELDAQLQAKCAHVNQLEKQLGKAQTKYKVKRGDQIDEMLAEYLTLAQCPIPIRRLGDGFYMFGSRKIYAKIINGKLVIRVGGGYMVIEKFIETYAEAEMDKLTRIAKQQGLDSWQELDFNQFGPAPDDRSPRTGKVNSKLSGSSRVKKSLTAAQIKNARSFE